MKRNISLKIKIPEGINISLENPVVIKNQDKELSRKFNLRKINLRQDKNEVFVEAEEATKREKKLAGTISGHIQNMIKGVSEGFTYKLQIASSHFPMRVEKKDVEKIITIKNYLGGKIDRNAKIAGDSKVDIKGDLITIFSMNKEFAGQTAANIESATRPKGKDKRIFQDGIYLIEKPGK